MDVVWLVFYLPGGLCIAIWGFCGLLPGWFCLGVKLGDLLHFDVCELLVIFCSSFGVSGW